jgi:hypothetical protein
MARKPTQLDERIEVLLSEGLLFEALGYLDDDGEMICQDCGHLVERVEDEFYRGHFHCSCGWYMEPLI